MASILGLDKFTRIANLILWGFNAPEYIKVNTVENAWIIAVHMELHGWKRVSIREQSQKLNQARHAWINITMDEIIKKYWNDINSCRELAYAPGLPIASLSGVVLIDGYEFILEAIIDRPVRDLTWSKAIPDYTIKGDFRRDGWRFHRESRLVNLIINTYPIIYYVDSPTLAVEFSVFDFPVGVLNQREILWEYEELENGF